LIDLAWNSSRLEGNTYSLLDAKRLIELGEEAVGRAHLEAQMILNHKDAIVAADDFARRFSIRAGSFMWLLGAGASAAAGIPTA
jgi:hypothetical protein